MVDDDELVRMLVTSTLADLGYTMLEAANAKQAMDLLHPTQTLDLLLTDVGLPGSMTGWQLADTLRESRPSLPVLFITGYPEDTQAQNAQSAPQTAIIAKPFHMQNLTREIHRLITRP
jgi:CheY-like chemotaxis protein